MATDNSGVIPNMTLTGKGPWERFSAGMHNIRYIAIDGAGNIGECTFKVVVTGSCLKSFSLKFKLLHLKKEMTAIHLS